VGLTLRKRKVYWLGRQGEWILYKPPLAALHTFVPASQSRAKQPCSSSSPELLARGDCQPLQGGTNTDLRL